AFFVGDVNASDRRRVADRQPCGCASRGRHRERREVLRAEACPERIAISLGSPSLSGAFSITFWLANATASSWPDWRLPPAPCSDTGVGTIPPRSPDPLPTTSTAKR